MKTKLILNSPCKANLYFRVLSKRDDGYHYISSLVQVFDLVDTLSFSLSNHEDLFSSDAIELAWDESNLIFKAVALFRKTLKKPFFIDIKLSKKIPQKAGLGGGSSNAATTLYALNELNQRPFTLEELKELSAQLGADVPLFFSTGATLCSGIGEITSDFFFNCDPFYLVKPNNIDLPTPLVYKELNLSKISTVDPKHLQKSFLSDFPVFINDLESAAFSLAPKLKEIKQALLETMDDVVMTGSGSAFICRSKKGFIPNIPNTWTHLVRPIYRKPKGWF